MGMRKGQVFVVGAIVFSALMLLAASSYQGFVLDTTSSSNKFYFQSALQQQSDVFNEEISENYSAKNLRKGFYSFNSFIETQSVNKNIDYKAFQVLILPEKDKTVLINYNNETTSYNYYADSWHNQSLNPNQYRVLTASDNNNYRLEIESLDISESFSTSKPTLIGHIEMKSEKSTWRNYVVR